MSIPEKLVWRWVRMVSKSRLHRFDAIGTVMKVALVSEETVCFLLMCLKNQSNTVKPRGNVFTKLRGPHTGLLQA